MYRSLYSAIGLKLVPLCSLILPLDALKAVESDKRSESRKAKHRKVQTREAQMGERNGKKETS